MTIDAHAVGPRPSYVKSSAPIFWLTTMISTMGLIGVLTGSSVGAVVFLGAWAFIVAAYPDKCLRLVFRTLWLWLIPVMALLSTIWSQAHEATLRAAVELILTIALASLTAGFVRPRAFVSAVSVSLMIGAIVSLIFGRYGVDGMTGRAVFLGIFASKNMMAMFMSFLTIFGAAVLADRGQPMPLRFLAGLSFFLSIPLLLRAHSAGALVTTVISFLVMGFTLVFSRMGAKERLLILICTTIVGTSILVLVVMLAFDGTLAATVSGFVSGVLGKDSTLTGRTELWAIALSEIEKRPLFGVGYSAFWSQGNLLAEGIWRAFQIESRSGFTFHDTFLEVAVELGWVGVTALVITLVFTVVSSVRFALACPGWTTTCFVTVIFCLLTRSIVEVDIPSPFSIGTYLLVVIASYSSDYARMQRSHAIRAVSLKTEAGLGHCESSCPAA
ncbi:MAG: O-antigen ligase family protein [Rhodospirillales bacterium]|nr:O-antigen ligase family protein [Rhodospirillales bacterium]